MDQKEIRQIKANLQSKPTEELQAIYATNDTNEYRPEAFVAIREILRERGSHADTLVPRQQTPAPVADPVRSVVITDIRMSFGSMVVFMVKWAIAAIPAAIILFLIGALLWGLLGAILVNIL
ncbi:MAG: hypothetical protein ISR85_06260 [Kiritimatiellales bacterium]|nr:hypothetical protein [Kiritimatiellota bacterium]MBL7012513.1 hypothetical protein [Kiritimatiellales bacterium]